MRLKITPDILLSMIISYHMLCAPTEVEKESNKLIFDKFKVSNEEKELYKNLILDPFWFKYGLQDTFLYKLNLTDALNHSTKIRHLVKDVKKGKDRSQFKNNLRSFYANFKPYFESTIKSIKPIIEERTRETRDKIDTIYTYAYEFTGIQIAHPKELEIKIIEGLHPGATGLNVKNNKGYVFMSPEDFKNTYWTTIIHEIVAHQTSFCARRTSKDLFGKYHYEADEGFAYTLTQNIANKINISNFYVNDDADQNNPVRVSYKIFSENWHKLKPGNQNANFIDWYRNCLVEFKEQHLKITPN